MLHAERKLFQNRITMYGHQKSALSPYIHLKEKKKEINL